MSYRTVKRLLGETSLERKCRFLFGTGLLLLIAGSFSLYGWRNAEVVYRERRTVARVLKEPILYHSHRTAFEQIAKAAVGSTDAGGGDLPAPPAGFSLDLLRLSSAEVQGWDVFSADPANSPPRSRPVDQAGYDALERIQLGEDEITRTTKDEYQFYAAARADQDCVKCHYHRDADVGDLLGVVAIKLPLTETKALLARNNFFLISAAVTTALLAMAAAYAIVRYVIVKPVLHLKEVAEDVSRGTIDRRADIRTGDEFEQLSHAFNRMLRHLITMQEEVREVNGDLDAKVEELARVNLRLYETNQMKDDFLATMSHELKTPLNSILGFSDVLAGSENLTDKQKRFVGNIERSGRDLMLLINDVLDVARIENGKLEIRAADFRLGELLERQRDAMQPLAGKKGVHLDVAVAPDVPVLRQDPGKLQQIVVNLLSNAIKFTPPGGRVDATAELLDDGQTFEVVVSDTGTGIPPEEQVLVFEKFRQGKTASGRENAITREHGGTGLGLSIVRELARLLGGEITLESEFGQGSRFIVRLPIRVREDRRPRAALRGDTSDDTEEPALPPAYALRLAPTEDPAGGGNGSVHD
ncbi:MAG: HAMP domain-containing sensor histidine kinase [Planctomycetota bacterium]